MNRSLSPIQTAAVIFLILCIMKACSDGDGKTDKFNTI
jgi:hypothetical protein